VTQRANREALEAGIGQETTDEDLADLAGGSRDQDALRTHARL
jgi:hypothetical protein